MAVGLAVLVNIAGSVTKVSLPQGVRTLSAVLHLAVRTGRTIAAPGAATGSAGGRLITLSATIAATKLMAAAITNAWWCPATTAPAQHEKAAEGERIAADHPLDVLSRQTQS